MYINNFKLHIDITLGGLNITNLIQRAFVDCTYVQLQYHA